MKKDTLWRVKGKNLNKCICYVLVCCLLFTCIGGAFLALPFNVYALPPALLKARTIGELIVTLLAGANTAVVSPGFVTPIYSNFGSIQGMDFESMIEDGILYQDGVDTETALENLGTGRAYNLDVQGFRDLVQNNWSLMQNNNIDAVLRINDIANSGTTGGIDNLGQIVKNVAENGYLALENTIAVVTNPETVITVGLQDIADAFIDVFAPNLDSGAPIDIRLMQVDGYNMYAGCRMTYVDNYNGPPGYDYGSMTGVIFCAVKTGTNSNGMNTYDLYECNYINNDLSYFVKSVSNDNINYFTSNSNYSNRLLQINNSRGKTSYLYGFKVFDTRNELNEYVNNLKNGIEEIENFKNPDIVNTENGNIKKDDIINPVISNGEGLEIIPQEEYEPFMQTVNNNYVNDTPNIIPTYNFINNYITEGVPEVVPTETPLIPDQPNIEPKPTVAPEVSSEILGNRLPGLESKFPFCIPFDLRNAFSILEEQRKAPKFEWNMKIDRFGIDESIKVDLSDFEPVAEVFRVLMLLTYIVGLIVLTRYLIKG